MTDRPTREQTQAILAFGLRWQKWLGTNAGKPVSACGDEVRAFREDLDMLAAVLGVLNDTRDDDELLRRILERIRELRDALRVAVRGRR